LIPEPVVADRVDRDVLRFAKDRETQGQLVSASNAVYNGGVRDYFSTDGARSTRYGEDYVELYQIYKEDNPWAPLWGTRLYLSGAVTRRSIVVSYPRSRNIWLSWFQSELRGTMIFAAEVYQRFGIGVDTLRVFSVLRGAEDLPLMVPGMLGMPVSLTPLAIEHLTLLPARERITIRAADLRDDPNGVAEEMARILRLRYGDSPLSMG